MVPKSLFGLRPENMVLGSPRILYKSQESVTYVDQGHHSTDEGFNHISFHHRTGASKSVIENLRVDMHGSESVFVRICLSLYADMDGGVYAKNRKNRFCIDLKKYEKKKVPKKKVSESKVLVEYCSEIQKLLKSDHGAKSYSVSKLVTFRKFRDLSGFSYDESLLRVKKLSRTYVARCIFFLRAH